MADSTTPGVLQQNQPSINEQLGGLDQAIKIATDARNAVELPSKEDLAAERKRYKREKVVSAIGDGISAIANMVSAANYAPNMYNDKTSLSAKTQARFDKAQKQHEADQNRVISMQDLISKYQGQKFSTLYQQYKDNKEQQRYDDQQKHQTTRENIADKQWQQTFDRQGEWHADEVNRWQKQFDEGKRQFNVTSSQNAARINMESKRLAKELANGTMSFSLGNGNGSVTLSSQQLNASNVSLVFNKLPESLRQDIGAPIKDRISGAVIGYEPPTTEAMLIAIGANIDRADCEEARKALQAVAGQKTSTGTMPGVGSSTMPGVK